MRKTLPIACAVLFGVLTVAVVTQQLPLRQNLEILKEGPIRADKVKEGLYVIRGPFLPCMTGCRPGQTSDGLIHESGDVAVRVTPAGLIVVDDKFASQAAEVLTQVKAVSTLPLKYVNLELVKLPFQIMAIPERHLVEKLPSHRRDQALHEGGTAGRS